MSEGGPDTFDEGYMPQLQPELLTKFTSSIRSTKFKDPPMEHLSNDHQDHPNQHKNSNK